MFSVIIPLYNKEKYLARTLHSVLAQTCDDFEVIIVNDGSRDGSLSVAESFLIDKRFKVISQANQGVSAARNRGVHEARGEYLAFLDADDEWEPTYLSEMLDCIKRYPAAGFLCSAGKVINSDGTEALRLARKYASQKLEVNFFENPHVFLHTSASIVNRSVFLKTAGFPLGMKRNQDFALFYSIGLITPFVYCGLPLSIYNGGVQGQATSTPAKEVLQHVINRYNHVFENYIRSETKNPLFLTFMRYELRHTFLMHLYHEDWESLNLFLNGLSVGLLSSFPEAELKAYTTRSLRKVMIYYIYCTKLLWRRHRFPRTGEYSA